MTRVIVILITLMFVLPSDGSAQSVPSPGERIRIKQVDGTVLTGRLTRLSPETIQLFVRSDYGTREVSVENIEVLETSLGRSSSSKNVAITMAVGAVVGAALGALAWEPCTFFCISPLPSPGELSKSALSMVPEAPISSVREHMRRILSGHQSVREARAIV